MNFGYPQFTEPKILKEYITVESHQLDKEDVKMPITVTNAVSWRSEGLRYKKNEVFLDSIELLDLLVSSTGEVLRSDVHGTLRMRCFLSGMPDLKLGLNDRLSSGTTGPTASRLVDLEDIKFHQCVRLTRFESDHTISFIPPDESST